MLFADRTEQGWQGPRVVTERVPGPCPHRRLPHPRPETPQDSIHWEEPVLFLKCFYWRIGLAENVRGRLCRT